MFKTLYGINFIILIYSVKTNNWPLIMAALFIFSLLGAWYLDHIQLNKLNESIKQLPTKPELHSKAQDFVTNSDLTWYQKIISIKAFLAGAEYILKKLK
jgi:hypothetical protein